MRRKNQAQADEVEALIRVDNETELGSLRRVTWLNNSLYDNPWYWLPMMYGWRWMVQSKNQEWCAR